MDYIPRSDVPFSSWLERFSGYAGNHQVTLGLTQVDMDALDVLVTAWNTKHPAFENAGVALKAARDAKEQARDAVESFVRTLTGRIQTCPTTTDPDREQLGITVRGQGGGAGTPVVGVTDERPQAYIDGSSRMKHVIRIKNQTSTGPKKGRPAGSIGCELYRKIGGSAPVSEDELQLVGLANKSLYVVDYPMADGGKTVHYMLRWVSANGEKGAWSETESATIAA